jgi:hypothetical protein
MAYFLSSEANNLERWPPLRLVKAAHAGSILIASQFLGIALRAEIIRLHTHYYGPHLGLFASAASILLLLGPVLTGTGLMAVTLWRLSDGLTRIKWDGPEIEAARIWAESHTLNRIGERFLWGFLFADIVLSYLVFNVWKITHQPATKMFFDSIVLLCIPWLVASLIGDRLREEMPTPTPPAGVSKYHPRKIHSDHWHAQKDSESRS